MAEAAFGDSRYVPVQCAACSDPVGPGGQAHGYERPGPHAANPHHLAGRVHDLEPLQQVAPVGLQGGPVGAELVVDQRHDLIRGQAIGRGQVAGRDDDRRLADDPVLPAGQFAELGQRLQAVPRVRLRGILFRPLRRYLGQLLLLAFFPFVASLACFFVSATVLQIAPLSSSSSRWAYQTSIVGICANAAMASR